MVAPPFFCRNLHGLIRILIYASEASGKCLWKAVGPNTEACGLFLIAGAELQNFLFSFTPDLQ